MYWKIDLCCVDDKRNIGRKFADTEAKAIKTIEKLYADYQGVIDRGYYQIMVTTLEETGSCTHTDFMSGIKRDVMLTDLIEGDSNGSDLKKMILERLHLTKAKVQLSPYTYRNPMPTEESLAIEIRDKIINDLDLVKMSDPKDCKKFLSRWKNDLLALCHDQDWYDLLINISGWRTFSIEGPKTNQFVFSRTGLRISLTGKETAAFEAAIARKKSKKKS